MQKKLIYFIVFLFCFTEVDAQENLVEHLIELMQVGVVDNESLLLNSNSVIGQVGNKNNVVVRQEQSGLLNNTIFSIQFQTENQAGIVQQGVGHATILVQDGSQNRANTWSVGRKTHTEIYQREMGMP